ncbi:MAG: hypothetical protein JST89_02575 [Cyanobacteria bacterium SZAS-4]|nr:hypothetical protein [Cyanobacteria bacterium SZAS-4]
MILEAFAEYLKAADPKTPSTEVLAQWLIERLSTPPRNNVDRVVHCEMAMLKTGKSQVERKLKDVVSEPKDLSAYTFTGKSASGKRLLRSLYEYCLSYDSQKWTRFVHNLKASDFNRRSVGN